MVKAVYYRNEHRLRVWGHACTGKKGEDLVCAAVSALVLTAAGNIACLAGQGDVLAHRLRLEDGNAEVSCTVKARLAPVVTLMLDTVVTGLQLLQVNYPNHLILEIG